MSRSAHEDAREIFGNNFPLVEKYHDFLVSEGIARGITGPHQADRMWERHIINSALVGQLIKDNATVLDIGTGGGLPGIPLYFSKNLKHITLLDPLQRRITFINDFFTQLPAQPENLDLIHGKAETSTIIKAIGKVDYVVARAVAPIDRLFKLAQPYLKPTAQLLAIKGESIHAELAKHNKFLHDNKTSATVHTLKDESGEYELTVAALTRIENE